MIVEINEKSGFCFGVVYAIQKAEIELNKSSKLYCLGEIVHNGAEVERLTTKGLITVDHDEFKSLKNCIVLIRAHGEPPATYEIAKKNNIKIVEASCSVVLKLQKRIKQGYNHIKANDGQVVIYGKEGHAEVKGLVGQVKGDAIVINGTNDLHKIDFTKPVNLFSQTTKSKDGYRRIEEEIRKRMVLAMKGKEPTLIVNNTICGQVSDRDKQLIDFAGKHDVILFVSGVKSSNGRMLYQVCKDVNKNTYFVSDIDELRSEWFKSAKSVGVCGATSTPRWLMEKIAEKINLLH